MASISFGENEKSLAYLIKATAIEPKNPEILFEFGRLCLGADLFSSGPEQVGHAVTAGNLEAGGHVHLNETLHGPGKSPLPALPSPGQRQQNYTLTGASSGLTGQVIVLLPKGYDPTKATTYPVIESLSGYPGTPQSNFRGFALTTTYCTRRRSGRVNRAVWFFR